MIIMKKSDDVNARCVHCQHRATRTYQRASGVEAPICFEEQCLRDEYSLDDEYLTLTQGDSK